MRVTSGNYTLPAIRIWQTTPFAAPRQRLIHTNPRSAACAISTAQNYHPNVWSNSSSGIGYASTPASCNCDIRSCPASALRFAVWSNSTSGIASNTASGAASSCPIFISSGRERAGAIAGAMVGSPTCSSICRTVVGYGHENYFPSEASRYQALPLPNDLGITEADESAARRYSTFGSWYGEISLFREAYIKGL